MLALGLMTAPAASAQSSGGAASPYGSGGTGYQERAPERSAPKRRARSRAATTVEPGSTGTIGRDGLATAPADAPPEVQAAIAAANRIVGLPYRYGGGHARVEDTGYDCSGTVSYALLGGGLMRGTPLDSGSFMRWGRRGRGRWVTVYTNPGHAFVVIAGLRLDTSAAGDPSGQRGPRWRPAMRSTRGFTARHPAGF